MHTHDDQGGRRVRIDRILDWLASQPRAVNGLTISGGEPTEQAEGVLALIDAFRARFPGADVLLLTGLIWQRFINRHMAIADACDVVIAGPYIRYLPALPLRGSSNQTVHLLTDLGRHRYHDLNGWAVHATQVVFDGKGAVTMGIPRTDKLARNLLASGAYQMSEASWDQKLALEEGQRRDVLPGDIYSNQRGE